MALITVEDCLEKINSQYDLVLLAKERTLQLNTGDQPLVPKDNDKNTVISLREIGEGKVSVKALEDSAINKLRKKKEENTELEDLVDEHTDSFDKIYKGEISKSGTAVLPSKRIIRRMPEKIQAGSENQDTKNINKEETKKEDEKTESLPSETKSE